MKTSKLLITGLLTLSSLPLFADNTEFFSTDRPDKLCTFGLRIGVNTSNRNIKNDAFNFWNVNSWGTGFDLGAVANINIRDYIAIQPGFFYESRSGKYAYSNISIIDEESVFTQFGEMRTYNFTIPVLAHASFNLASNVTWSVDFGPYLNFRLGSTGDDHIYTQSMIASTGSSTIAKPRNFDFGFKMGTGFHIMSHYYVGIHYLAGATNVWKNNSLGGRNKAWTFTAGYDF